MSSGAAQLSFLLCPYTSKMFGHSGRIPDSLVSPAPQSRGRTGGDGREVGCPAVLFHSFPFIWDTSRQAGWLMHSMFEHPILAAPDSRFAKNTDHLSS